MLQNNNGRVISRMTKRSFAANRRRNFIMIAAVMLSSFLLFTILTVGITYFKMHRIQDMRMYGADFDAILMGGFKEEQRKQCEDNDRITTIGVEAKAAYAKKTDADDTLHTVLIWSDETYWNRQKMPAVERVEGTYPQKDNEIMVTKAALKDCGKQNLGIGDSFPLTYQDKMGTHTKEFFISGMWDGYGDDKVFYVSKSFYEQSGYQFEDVNSGILYLNLSTPILSEKQQDIIRDSLGLGKRQRLFYNAGLESSTDIVLGMAGLILMTALSAYLLIYNILYLSVSGNIRYFGLLQTVGMTGRQIRELMKKQMFIIGMLGIGSGILLGTAVSFFIIPGIVKILGIRGGDVEVSFHPAVFLVSIIVAGFTVCLGSRKPAKIATAVSPVEALGYRQKTAYKASHKTGKGSLLWRMAAEQFVKNKKKTALIVLSMAVSLSVFLCLVIMIASQGARTVMSNYMDYDLIMTNDTLIKEDSGEWAQIMDESFRQKIRENPAVREVDAASCTKIIVPWEADFADTWMREFYDAWMDHPYEEDIEEYKLHPEKFYSNMKGINEMQFDYLNSALEEPVDKAAFMSGKTCILYQDDLSLDLEDVKGKTITFALYDEREKSNQLTVAGMTSDGYYGYSAGIAPVIVVSEAYVDELVEEPYIYRMGLVYAEEYDESAEAQMKGYMEESFYNKDFSYTSKIDSMKSIKKAQGNMMGVGIGIVAILALIGIMNYVNTVTGNIQSRQVELSILESVGMTEKQVKRMLMREGLLFAGSSLLLTATVGLGVSYVFYQKMNYMKVAFEVPALPVLVMAVAAIAVCLAIPLAAYRLSVGKKSIVERIRGFE